MASTLLPTSACNHRDDAALWPGPGWAPQRTVATADARHLAALLLLVSSAMVPGTGCAGLAFGPTLMPTPNLYGRTPDNPFPDVPPALRTGTVDIVYVTDREPERDRDSERDVEHH